MVFVVYAKESVRFEKLLPLKLELKDYAATGKIADLPRHLDTSAAPDGYTPNTGDLAYYAPWGNIAIFHKPFSYSSGLVRLGHLITPVEPFRRKRVLASSSRSKNRSSNA